MTFTTHPAILIPLALLADVSLVPDHQWELALLNYGVAGAVIIWFMWRDKQDRGDRDRQHKENLEAQRNLEKAFRANTTSTIVAFMALKNLDQQYSQLMERLQHDNENPDL